MVHRRYSEVARDRILYELLCININGAHSSQITHELDCTHGGGGYVVFIVQYLNKCVILSFFPFLHGMFAFNFYKIGRKPKQEEFSYEFQNEMERLLLFQKR